MRRRFCCNSSRLRLCSPRTSSRRRPSSMCPRPPPALFETLRLNIGLPSFSPLLAIRASTSTGTHALPALFITASIPPIIAFSNQAFASAACSASHSTTTSSWQTSTGMALGHWSRRSHERMCGFSKYANRRGAKSARSVSKGLLALLALSHIGISRTRACARLQYML
jgi:hypothetical protein